PNPKEVPQPPTTVYLVHLFSSQELEATLKTFLALRQLFPIQTPSEQRHCTSPSSSIRGFWIFLAPFLAIGIANFASLIH
ncbi:hypothetical protein PCANC_02335, partial [Puccinia coronata f. sp. avenae]